MLADTSLPCGSDANLSAVGSLSQKLSHHQMASVACSGRVPLVEQRVLLQFTLLRQPVKRLSRRTQVSCLKAKVAFVPLPIAHWEPKLVGVAHATMATSSCPDQQREHMGCLQSRRCRGPNTGSVQPMGFRQVSLCPIVLRAPA